MNKETAMAAQEAIDTLLETCNIMGVDEDLSVIISNAITKEHRTIQQSFVKVMHDALIQYGERHIDYHDARNEASVEFCNELKEMDWYFPYI